MRRFRKQFQRVQLSRNHCEMAVGATAAGTEDENIVVQTVSAPTNRSTQVEIGSVLRRMRVEAWATDATPVNGKHQCMMVFRPGASTLINPIASWFATSDPITEDMLDSRREAMERVGVHTIVTIAGASFAPHFVCYWKGRRILRDGDDIIVYFLDDAITNWTAVCDYTFEDA